MRISTFFKPLSFIPALLLMYMIFTFSAQEGDLSSQISFRASTVIVKTADRVFDMGLDDYQVSYFATKIHGVTRKLAHMGEYFLLAIAVSFPLYVYGLHGILLMILAGGICIAFACGDEYHQSFVAGRAASTKDVAIDSFGVFVGIIIVRIIGWTGRMTLFRPRERYRETSKMSRKEQKRMLREAKRSYSNAPYPNAPYAGADRRSPVSEGYGNQPFDPAANGFGNPQFNPASNGYGNPQYDPASNRYENPQYGPVANGYGNPQYGSASNGYGSPQYGSAVNRYGNPQPGASYAGPPGQDRDYYEENFPEHSSDELSEDMPLSHLLKPRKRNRQ